MELETGTEFVDVERSRLNGISTPTWTAMSSGLRTNKMELSDLLGLMKRPRSGAMGLCFIPLRKTWNGH